MAAHKVEKQPPTDGVQAPPNRLTSKEYDKELRRLQTELLRFEEWVRHQGLRVVVILKAAIPPAKAG